MSKGGGERFRVQISSRASSRALRGFLQRDLDGAVGPALRIRSGFSNQQIRSGLKAKQEPWLGLLGFRV